MDLPRHSSLGLSAVLTSCTPSWAKLQSTLSTGVREYHSNHMYSHLSEASINDLNKKISEVNEVPDHL